MNKKEFIFIFLLFCLALVSYWRVLSFGMWMDDAKLMWASLYNIKDAAPYFNHPGLAIYFIFLSRIIGDYFLLWQLCGIIIKTLCAYLVGKFIFALTDSKPGEYLAAMLFAVSFVGLEVVSSPIMSIAGIVTIPLLLSLIYFIKSIKIRIYNFKKFIFLFIYAVILDPGRMLSVIFIFPFLLYLLPNNLNKKIVFKRLIQSILAGTFLAFPLLVLWFVKFVSNSQIAIGIVGLFHDPQYFITKITRVKNMLAAVGNIYVALVMKLGQNEQNTGIYNQIYVYIGISIIVFGLICFILGWYKQKKYLAYIAFSILWSFVMYIPNWFSEPRAPMSASHRYLYISSFGVVWLLTLLLLKVRNLKLRYTFLFLLLTANIYYCNQILAWQSTYRGNQVIERIWGAIDKDVPNDKKSYLFYFTGKTPWINQSIELFGADRYLLRRKVEEKSLAPIIVLNQNQLKHIICVHGFDKKIGDIYAWQVLENGSLINSSLEIRLSLINNLEEEPCEILSNL